MATEDLIGWDGRHAVVVGGATGMGRAAGDLVAALGGTVTVLDVRTPTGTHDAYVPVDLRSVASIDAALEAITTPVHALFCCAGIAEGPDLPQINFIGQRHLLEALVARDGMPPGSAVVMIASIGGMGWERELDVLREFLDQADFDAASAWIDAHPDRADYRFAKQAMIAYCGLAARELQRRGLRINATAPGPTLTPLMAATPAWQGFEARFRDLLHREGSSPEEQAWPLVFLASPAASFINGTCLIVDGGFVGAGTVGSIDDPIVGALLGSTAPA